MPSSTSHKRGQHQRGAHGHGGDSDHRDDGGGGGGGGGDGKLVKVAFARTQAEAEMIQGLLMESGIPSVLRRSPGFDVPEFLTAGPHNVLVSSDLEAKARKVLAETMIEDEAEERAELEGEAQRLRGGADASPIRLALWVIAALLIAAILVWIVYQLS